jgi:hypothetical protein
LTDFGLISWWVKKNWLCLQNYYLSKVQSLTEVGPVKN